MDNIAIGKIVKRGSQWCVISEKTGRSFGCFPSRDKALKRLRQVEFFKHQKGSLANVINFLQHYGHDFEPEAFTEKSLTEYVAEAKANTTCEHGKDPHECKDCMADAKKQKHMSKCAEANAASMVKQTVIVKKGPGCATSREEATTHAKKHGSTKTIRETGDSYRFRQRPPSDFDQKTFRTVKVSKCVTYVLGKLKGE